MSCLDEIFERDEQLIDWIQVALGYSILGLTREHCFFVCHGLGRNGKGVLLETIEHVLGSYSHKTRFDTFLQRDGGSNTRALEAVGNLKGKRFVVASEVNDGTRFDAARIKELTGGDTLSGTALYSSKFEFTPTHTLWLACNHLPEIKDNTFAITLLALADIFPSVDDLKVCERPAVGHTWMAVAGAGTGTLSGRQ
jgi:putative DNA primase/helicase